MQTIVYTNSPLSEIEYLVRMINSHELCKVEIHSVLCKDSAMFALKCKRYTNICKSVLQSCLPFAKVIIVEEEEVFAK
jgi:pyruvate/oxaloacetate carboxyltransferase